MGITTTALKNAKFTKKGLLTKVAGPAFYGYQGIEAFKERQDEGDGFFSSALQGVGEAIIYSTLVGTAAELIGWGIENVPDNAAGSRVTSGRKIRAGTVRQLDV